MIYTHVMAWRGIGDQSPLDAPSDLRALKSARRKEVGDHRPLLADFRYTVDMRHRRFSSPRASLAVEPQTTRADRRMVEVARREADIRKLGCM
jgi:hypothetical protein